MIEIRPLKGWRRFRPEKDKGETEWVARKGDQTLVSNFGFPLDRTIKRLERTLEQQKIQSWGKQPETLEEELQELHKTHTAPVNGCDHCVQEMTS